jgi:hypothetical protein
MVNKFTQINLARKVGFSNNKYSIPKGIGMCWVGYLLSYKYGVPKGTRKWFAQEFFLAYFIYKR